MVYSSFFSRSESALAAAEPSAKNQNCTAFPLDF
jgi:hypothetical protein